MWAILFWLWCRLWFCWLLVFYQHHRSSPFPLPPPVLPSGSSSISLVLLLLTAASLCHCYIIWFSLHNHKVLTLSPHLARHLYMTTLSPFSSSSLCLPLVPCAIRTYLLSRENMPLQLSLLSTCHYVDCGDSLLLQWSWDMLRSKKMVMRHDNVRRLTWARQPVLLMFLFPRFISFVVTNISKIWVKFHTFYWYSTELFYFLLFYCHAAWISMLEISLGQYTFVHSEIGDWCFLFLSMYGNSIRWYVFVALFQLCHDDLLSTRESIMHFVTAAIGFLA